MLLLKNNASIDTYDSNGNIATEAKSAVTQSYTYNRDGTVASIVTTNNIDNTSETTSYTYYLNGNLKTETLPDNTIKTYTYNNRDMLVTEALSTGKTTTYAYNNSGNRTSKTVTQNSQNTVTSYTYDNANRLTQEQTGSSSISYTYDDNGRLISRTSGSVTDTFAYNGYNEMKRAVVGGVTTDYTYYVDGLRRSKKTGSNTSYEFWDGDNIIADTVSGYTIANNYIRGLRLAEISNGTNIRQYTFNAHGDVTGLVDTTTGAVTDYTYDAYGNEDNASATDTNPFRYSGEYYDAETGFIYLRARYYDPSIGRFTAEDPIRDGTNWYVYCYNNPVKYVDPWGLEAMLDQYISTNYAGQRNIAIAIQRPVANSRVAGAIINNKLEHGHSFIRVDDGSGNVRYLGFRAAEIDLVKMTIGQNVTGKFTDDRNEKWNVAKVYELSETQYDALNAYISQTIQKQPSYNIETYNCTNFAVGAVLSGGASGLYMPIKRHNWTLPSDMKEQLSNYAALPSWLPVSIGVAILQNTMGNFFGYTPADAAQDLKKSEGTTLLNYDGSIKTIENTSRLKTR